MRNYMQLAMRTRSDLVGTNLEVSPDLLHAALGIASETIEVMLAIDPTEILAELGDLCWFIALAGRELGFDPFDPAHRDQGLSNHILLSAANAFVSGVKAAYAYGKPLDVARLRTLLVTLVALVENYLLLRGGDTRLEQLLAANIAKLQARFPDRFEAARAIQRDAAAEREAVEDLL